MYDILPSKGDLPMKTSDAKLRANAKYLSQFKRISVSLPPETVEQIKATNPKSITNFIQIAIDEKLQRS